MRRRPLALTTLAAIVVVVVVVSLVRAGRLHLPGTSSGSPSDSSSSPRASGSASPRPTTSPSPTGPLTVVGLGDSVMAGTACDCAGIVSEYAGALATRTGRQVTGLDLAAGGLVTQDVLEDLLDSQAHRDAVRRAGVVLVTIGANDLYPELNEWEQSSCPQSCYLPATAEMGSRLSKILDIIDSLRPHATGPVLVTNYWNVFTDGDVARRTGGESQVDWSDAITAAANHAICGAVQTHHAVCVDLVAPFKGSGRDPTPLLAADGDHPDAAGVVAIVRALMAATPAV